MTMSRWFCVGLTAVLVSCVTSQEQEGSSAPLVGVESLALQGSGDPSASTCRPRLAKCSQDKQCCSNKCFAGQCFQLVQGCNPPPPPGTECASSADCCGFPCIFNQATGMETCGGTICNTPPRVACTPSVNPSGSKVPTASNEDGFFEVVASSPCGLAVTVTLGGVKLANGEHIKITESPGQIGVVALAEVGQAGVQHFLVGSGDAQLVAVDAHGNESSATCTMK
jgi:hypothetical protein